MKNLEAIAEDLFNKIRGRFPNVTIGNENAEVTNDPKQARYFDFEYKEGDRKLGKVSISLEENGIAVMYSNDFVANEDSMTQDKWYNFLKELRQFSKKRLLNFDTRNITKSNLDKRDYKFLAQTRAGENQMTESTMYGTSKSSFQNIGNARLSIKHSQHINQENTADRARHISAIYVENAEGERFKYPYKHLSGARAMARHVSEGGTPYDTFGTHITGLSEELSKLRKFKTYLGRSSVMAESLAAYADVVKERMESIKKNLKNLQKETYYKEAFESYEEPVFEDVPDDVKENWIDELTIKQFNEELQDVFPYIYKLVGEATRAKELTPEDLLGEAEDDMGRTVRGSGNLDRIQGPANKVKVRQGMTLFSIAQMFNDQNNMGGDVQQFVKDIMELNNISNPRELRVGQELVMPYSMGTGPDGAGRGLPPGGFTNYESQLESDLDELMGQFAEGERHGNDSMYDKCWKGYRKVPGKSRGEKGSCKKIEGVELESLDSYFEGRDDAPEGDRITTDENPLVTTYDDEFDQGNPGISGHMNLKTYMSIMGISEKYQDMLAKAVLDGGRGKKISVPDEVKADYDAEREEEGLKPRALWIELSQHHEKEKESDANEGNAYAHAVRKAKMDGKKKGDKIDGPDGDEITLEKDDKTPLGEFILSYFDRETGQFPKGETAVLTMVEKDYGEEFIEPAKQFIEQINNKVAEVMGYKEADDTSDLERIRGLAGL